MTPKHVNSSFPPRAARKRDASRNLLPLKAVHSNGASRHLCTPSLTLRYASSAKCNLTT
ncbi:Uncharacterized protein DAT39_013660, partial [Clarias magur]